MAETGPQRSVDFPPGPRHPSPMDTIKILLSLTVALLLGALAMSWKGFQQDQKGTPPSELAEVQRQIDQIRVERERLKLERERLMLGDVAVGSSTLPAPMRAPVPAPVPAVPPMEVIPEQAAEAPPAALPPPPADEPVPALPGMDERAKKIAAAPAVAKITEWVENPELGAFATIEVKDPALKADTVICVRRNSGILGRLKVSQVTPEGAIANAMGQFPGVKPAAGDELILEP
jgi:hypothetical protein